MNREKVIKGFELFIKEFELFIKEIHPVCTGEGVELDMFRNVLAMLKEQESWINEIAEYKQSVSGSGMHELDDYEKGKLDGLQIAWNIISEGR